MIGTFLAVVRDHILKEVGEKKTPCVSVAVETVENVQTHEPVIQTAYWSGWLTDLAVDGTLKSVTEALGWDGTDLSELNGTGNFVGKEVWVVLEEETYQDKVQTRVRWLNKVGGGGAQIPFAPEKAQALSDRLKGRVLKYRQANPKGAPGAAQVHPSEDFDFTK